MTKTSPRRPDVRRRLTLLAGHPAVVLTATTSLALVAGWAGARGATAFTFAAASALGAVLILAWTCRPERDLPLVVQALSRFSTQRDYAGARAAIAQIRRRPTAAALDALCEALLDTVDISEAEDTDVRKVLRFFLSSKGNGKVHEHTLLTERVLNAGPIAIVIHDGEDVLYTNEAAEHLFGLTRDKPLPPVAELFHPGILEPAIRKAQFNALLKGEAPSWQHVAHQPRGAVEWIHRPFVYDPDPSTHETAIVSIGIPVAERLQGVARVEWLHLHDPLTKLLNRTAFLEHLEAALYRARRYCTGSLVVALALPPLFSPEEMAALGKKLASGLRPGDIAARVGIRTLAVLIHPLPPADQYGGLFARLLELARSAASPDTPVEMTAGVLLPDDLPETATPEDLLDQLIETLRPAPDEILPVVLTGKRPRRRHLTDDLAHPAFRVDPIWSLDEAAEGAAAGTLRLAGYRIRLQRRVGLGTHPEHRRLSNPHTLASYTRHVLERLPADEQSLVLLEFGTPACPEDKESFLPPDLGTPGRMVWVLSPALVGHRLPDAARFTAAATGAPRTSFACRDVDLSIAVLLVENLRALSHILLDYSFFAHLEALHPLAEAFPNALHRFASALGYTPVAVNVRGPESLSLVLRHRIALMSGPLLHPTLVLRPGESAPDVPRTVPLPLDAPRVA